MNTSLLLQLQALIAIVLPAHRSQWMRIVLADLALARPIVKLQCWRLMQQPASAIKHSSMKIQRPTVKTAARRAITSQRWSARLAITFKDKDVRRFSQFAVTFVQSSSLLRTQLPTAPMERPLRQNSVQAFTLVIGDNKYREQTNTLRQWW